MSGRYRLADGIDRHRTQSGLALVTVLLIVALMVTLLGFLVEQQQLLIRRIANQNIIEQGYQYATGVDAWASRLLHDDANFVDYWGEDWARFGDPPDEDGEERESFSLDLGTQEEKPKIPTIDFGFDGLAYQIEDLQGRFNLNNLSNREAGFLRGQKTIFLNLLELLNVGEFDTREQLYGSLVDWLDENDLVSANGIESPSYRIKATPYHAADQKLTSVGELRFVEGFSEDVINAIKPYVTVLPIENAAININTTSSIVLASLSTTPVTDTGAVDAFLAERLNEGFPGYQAGQISLAQDAIIRSSVVGGTYVRNMMQTDSQFFQINTRITLGDSVYCTNTKVLRNKGNAVDSGASRVIILNSEHNSLCNEIVR